MICSGITTSQYRLARPEKAAGDTSVLNFALNSHLSFDKRFLSDRSRTPGLTGTILSDAILRGCLKR